MKNNELELIKYPYDDLDKEWIDRCNICEDVNWTIIAKKDRYGFNATSTMCRSCGFITTNPRLTKKGYSKFYESYYRRIVSAFHGKLINAETIQPEQEIYASDMAALLSPFIKKNINGLNFLDIGGSTGIISAYFSKHLGLVPTVIDPAPFEIAKAIEMGIKTVQGFIEDWEANSEQFDVVGVFQTIDHLLDVRCTFEKIRNLIAKDGILIFDIVDTMFVARKEDSIESALKIDHPSNLNEKTTELLLKRTGFHILQRSISKNGDHIVFICKPTKKSDISVRTKESTDLIYDELRRIQSRGKK